MDATATTIERAQIRSPEDLPDDPVILKRLVFQLLGSLNTSERQKAELAERLQYLLRRRYGPQSERSDPAQLALFTKQIMELLGHAQSAPEQSSPDRQAESKPSANGVGKARRSGGGRRSICHEWTRSTSWAKRSVPAPAAAPCVARWEPRSAKSWS